MFKDIGKFIGEATKVVITAPIDLGIGFVEGVISKESSTDKVNEIIDKYKEKKDKLD